MKNELFITEVFFFVIAVVAAVLSREFILARNGLLRKLMIWYFIIEVYVYASSGLYFYLYETGKVTMSIHSFRPFLLGPKFIMMLRILYYLRHKK